MPLLNEINVKGTAYPIVTDDGYYQDMTVGDAEQLVSTQFVEDSEPYGYRTTGGSSDVGNREYVRGITGGTVAWNQMIRNGDFSDGTNNWSIGSGTMSVSGGVLTFTAASRNAAILAFNPARVFPNGANNHKYFCTAVVKLTTATNLVGFRLNGGYKTIFTQETTAWQTLSTIYNLANADNGYVQIIDSRSSGWDAVQVSSVMVIDLTQMFGTTIADYIYSLEQANAGAGVAFFRKLFPNDYYPYDSGTLKSVEGVSSHEMVGFNQWDEEWELGDIDGTTGADVSNNRQIRTKNYIRVFPLTSYYFHVGDLNYTNNIRARFYDADKNYIGYSPVGTSSITPRTTFRPPENCRYMRFAMQSDYGNTYKNDICINLSWSGWRNGEYEPYEKHSYPLDSSLTLRGIPKLDAQNHLYYDGDEYAPDGTVTRRYGVVDLGTLSFDKTGSGLFWTDGVKGAIKTQTDTDNVTGFMICPPYTEIGSTPISGPSGTNPSPDKVFALNAAGRLFFNNLSYTDAVTFKTAMSGVYLVYELAEPTTETAEPYMEIQICDDFGTEEYVSTSIVPVGHETGYPANLRDKLQHLPDLADTDGSYIISQSNKHMALAPLPIVVPAPPTTDGTYTMKATVESGVPTMVWVADE